MNNEEFAEMMQRIIEKEERRLQLGSSSFIRRDQEIMEMIDRARKEGGLNGKKRRKR